MNIVAVTALIGYVCDAVIRTGEQAFGIFNSAVDDILREADTEASGVKLLEVTAAENQITAHLVNTPVLLRVAVDPFSEADKFTVIRR